MREKEWAISRLYQWKRISSDNKPCIPSHLIELVINEPVTFVHNMLRVSFLETLWFWWTSFHTLENYIFFVVAVVFFFCFSLYIYFVLVIVVADDFFFTLSCHFFADDYSLSLVFVKSDHSGWQKFCFVLFPLERQQQQRSKNRK